MFTTLTDADLATVAAGFQLGEVRSWRPIAAGTINSNFELVTETGRWFLRVNEGKAVGDVTYEGELVAALAGHGVPAPVPLAGPDGHPYLRHDGDLISVFAWRPGLHRAAADVSVADAHAVGEVIARMHVAGLALPAAMRRPSIYDHAHLRARFDTLRGHTDQVLDEALHVHAAELEWLEDRAEVRAAATHGVIHGDLFRDNVLFEGDGHVLAVLDFEQASGGSLAYDLAVAINDWAWANGAPRAAQARALLAGYYQVRRLPPEDRAALSTEVRAAAARFTITRITDVYLPKIANPDKDFREFLARVIYWSGAKISAVFDPKDGPAE
jgi:homoserine kinase type II